MVSKKKQASGVVTQENGVVTQDILRQGPPYPDGLTSSDGVIYRLVPIEWIIPNPDNYNQHPPEQIVALKEDFKRFGQVSPYVVKQRAEQVFMLAAGEGCTIAVAELLEEDPIRYAKLTEAKVVIVPQEWTEADVRGFMVADNETGRMSTPDDGILARLLQEQQQAGYSLLSVGSDEEALRQMLEAIEKTSPEQVQFKEYDESIEEGMNTEVCQECGKLCLKGKA